MNKTYVLDTNVLLHDPNALFAFKNNTVVIPTVVLEEIDSFKNGMTELAKNARYVSRLLDNLREMGKLHVGVPLDNGGILKTYAHDQYSPIFKIFNDNKNDNAIIAVAYELSQENNSTVILVSKDTNVRVKSDVVDVFSEDYFMDKVVNSEDNLYNGYSEIYVEDEIIDKFYTDRQLSANKKEFKIYPDNHFFILKGSNNKSAVAKKHKNKLIPLYNYNANQDVFGISHKNVGQMMALELLLDDNIPIVTLNGKAGTGKTLLALATGLHKVSDERKYKKVLIGRPIMPLGKDIGYLPGDINEKLRPWMQPIYDNLEFLFNAKDQTDLERILAGLQGELQVEALTYIRGRSIPNQFIIIDEAQNLTKHEIKTIVTRLGEGSKLVLLGDPYQIDNPYLDMYSNGLTYFIEKMKDESDIGHITLTKGERSSIAQLCADKL